MAWGLYTLRHQLTNALQSANWLLLSSAILIAIIYLILNASVWGLISKIFGSKSPRHKTASLWIECEAMRWLPGGIWGYASRVVEAKRIGLNKTNSGLSLALELILTVTAWAILGLIGFLLSPRLRTVALIYLDRLHLSPTIVITAIFAGLIISAIIFLKNPLNIRTKITNFLHQLKPLLSDWPLALRALVEYLILSLFYSAGFLLCLNAIGVSPSPNLLEAAGSYGLAWIVGFFAFGAPGGMGVREGFLYLTFQPLGIAPQVATAAILWRAIQIITELLLLSIIKIFQLSPQTSN